MLISLHWLSDHLDLTGLSVDDLSQLLTFAGVEVEGIEHRGVSSDRVVVAQILSFGPHPDADKLSVCRVDGGQTQPLQIVCGAKNFKAGDKVPLALEGAVLPGDFKIKKGKLRGVESEGMMCSGKELGLGEDSDGLLILPVDAPVGKPLGEFLGSDTLITIEVTPNRPDLLSHAGLARELRALLANGDAEAGGARRRQAAGGQPGASSAPNDSSPPQPRATSGGPPPSVGRNGDRPGVTLAAPAACPFYTARIIRGLTVGPSPEWLRKKLDAIGLRPINAVVDVTNYVLHDLGQPLHAFDLSKLSGGLVVRAAAEGESFPALDGRTYALTPTDLVIADQARAVALAGVMGGAETGVTETTTDVLLESAYFMPSGIRRTSRALGLGSDSSYRFERGVDPDMIEVASARAAALIVDLAGGATQEPVVVAGEKPVLTGQVPLHGDQVRRVLGSAITDEAIDAILARLGLVKSASWVIPSYRQDLQRPIDLIEEVARVAGLDGIPARTMARFAAPGPPDAAYDFALGLKTRLAAQGFYEARTIKLISAKQLADSLGFDRRRIEPLPLRNPLSDDHTHLRPSLVPGLLAVAAHNRRQGAEALRFFEAGTVFATALDGKAGSLEAQALTLLLSGPHVPPSWLKKAPFPTDLSDLRGVIDALFARPGVRLKKTDHPALGLAAEVHFGGKVVGLCGQLAPARARELDARSPVYVAEFNLALLQPLLTRGARYEEIPRFPAITRDVALEMPADLAHGQIDDFFAKQIKEPLLESLFLFDVFSDPTGEKLPVGRKSLAYSLTYRDKTRTLEAKEIDAAHSRILAALQAKLPVSIR